jgi:penicillin amidase
MIKAILKGAGLLIVALLVAGGAFAGHFAWRLSNSVPSLVGEARVPGAAGPISIVRDEHGVPHIFAQTQLDTLRGLGFAHAQDRFFQMDATRRAMKGTLSEVFGARTLAMDARARTMNWAGVAQAQVSALSPDARAALDAYAEGVNAALPVIPTPPEYALFFAKPTGWEAVDCVLASLAMTDALTGGEHLDRARAELSARLNPEQIKDFMTPYPDFAARSYGAGDIAVGEATMESDMPGSNAWVVAGARTGTGKPVLANDPHLPLAAPGPFYLSRLQTPAGTLIGASLPGAPAIVIGRSDHLAWGTTTHQIDAADEIPLTAAMAVTEETATIRVRTFGLFLTSRAIKIRRTQMGPVLDSRWFKNEEAYGEKDIVLRTIADDPDNGLIEAVFRASNAQSVDAYFDALKPWTAPPQNLVVADTAGNIGLISPARYPKRTPDGAWDGEIPIRVLAKNPARGYFATANNLQTPPDFPHPMPGGHDPYRVTLIDQALAKDSTHNRDNATALQTSQASLLPLHLRQPIAQATPQTLGGRTLLARLQAWDGVAAPDRAEPTMFAYVVRALGEALYKDELGEKLFKSYAGPRDVFLDAVLNGAVSSAWCDDVDTQPIVESCAISVGKALDVAAARLEKDHGKAEANWAWGQIHAARFAHPALGGLPLVGEGFVVTAPFGGNSTSVNVARHWHTRDGYNTVHAAGLRMVIDFSDLNASRFMMAPGQSGHPRSKHFGDLAPKWAAGTYFEIRSDWGADKPPAGAALFTLKPS